jgi:hypothetical protein
LESSRLAPAAWLFTAAVFLGSALLFLVQPMAAKMLLPIYGGAPGVWNTSMVFFQAALLAGYAYAHFSFRWLGPRVQPLVHLAVLGLAATTLPIAFAEWAPGEHPSLRLLGQLTAGVGLPFLIVSAGAPLLQRWYAASGGPRASDPYFLYAASNLASILALAAYPFLLEPSLRLGEQSQVWTFGYFGLLLVVSGCAALVLFKRPVLSAEPTPASAGKGKDPIFLWMVLAFVPSSLLLGVTTYLTTNIASAPLLWVVPLALYLATFVAAFSGRRKFGSGVFGRAAALALAPMVLVIVLEATDPILVLGALHLGVFTLAALYCHTRLYETRPEAARLTGFYLWISVGGVLGGAFNALAAPVLFDTVAEYPAALVLLALLLPRSEEVRGSWLDLAAPAGVFALTGLAVLATNAFGLEPSPARTGLTLGLPALASFLFADRPIRYGLSLGAVFLAARVFGIGSTGELLLSERSFFGVHRVLLTQQGAFRELMHGNTIHGRQSADPARSREALTYYHRTGPAGQTFEALQEAGRLQTVGLVGLGVGSLATYSRPGQTFRFFEIDPKVVDIARDSGHFTFLRDAAGSVEMRLGDARLTLADEPDGAFDLLVLDAFSSDAIPMHLLTVEALELYRSKLASGGVLAFHISNRYLELGPVLAAAARETGMTMLLQEDVATDDELALGKTSSSWAVLAPHADSLEPLRKTARWEEMRARSDVRAWTDDYSNLLQAFWERRLRDRELR